MKRPNLPNLPKLKTSAETDLEKENERIGKCMHPDEDVHAITNDSPTKNQLDCDFNAENNIKHKLFGDSQHPGAAMNCTNCGALICKDCYSGTPMPSPTSDEENNENINY